MKIILAEWISHSLRRALNYSNITSGFWTTGVYPLNPHTIDNKFGPSKLLVEKTLEDEDDGYDEMKQEVLQELEQTLEEPTCIDYKDYLAADHVPRVCPSNQ